MNLILLFCCFAVFAKGYLRQRQTPVDPIKLEGTRYAKAQRLEKITVAAALDNTTFRFSTAENAAKHDPDSKNFKFYKEKKEINNVISYLNETDKRLLDFGADETGKIKVSLGVWSFDYGAVSLPHWGLIIGKKAFHTSESPYASVIYGSFRQDKAHEKINDVTVTDAALIIAGHRYQTKHDLFTLNETTTAIWEKINEHLFLYLSTKGSFTEMSCLYYAVDLAKLLSPDGNLPTMAKIYISLYKTVVKIGGMIRPQAKTKPKPELIEPEPMKPKPIQSGSVGLGAVARMMQAKPYQPTYGLLMTFVDFWQREISGRLQGHSRVPLNEKEVDNGKVDEAVEVVVEQTLPKLLDGIEQTVSEEQRGSIVKMDELD